MVLLPIFAREMLDARARRADFEIQLSGAPHARIIPLNDELRSAPIEYRRQVQSFAGTCVVSTERSLATSPQTIVNPFSAASFD